MSKSCLVAPLRLVLAPLIVLLLLAGCVGSGSNSDGPLLQLPGSESTAGPSSPTFTGPPGSADTSFGNGGAAQFGGATGGTVDTAYASTVDSTGRLYVVSASNDSVVDHMVLYRLTADGTLDTTFGTGGKAIAGTIGTMTYTYGYALAIDPALNRIYVVGRSIDNPTTPSLEGSVIWAFDGSGNPDTGFNGGSNYTTTATATTPDRDSGYALAFDSSYRPLVTGSSRSTVGIEMAAWRYQTNGALDTTFAGTGYTSDTFGGTPGQFGGLGVIQHSNGTIYSAGYAIAGYLAVWAFTSGGGLSGEYGVPPVGIGDQGNALAEAPDGNLIVAGFSGDASYPHASLWRFSPTATPALDSSFGSGGQVFLPFSQAAATQEFPYAAVVDTQGRIIATGISTTPSGTSMIVWRFLADGTLDPAFAGTGYVLYSNTAGANPAPDDEGHGIQIDSIGRYVVTGWGKDSSSAYRVLVWRINP